MSDHKCTGRTRPESRYSSVVYGRKKKMLNFDVQSYQFGNLDLEEAVKQLAQQDREFLILYLMGHTHRTIAEAYTVSRSMVSKKLRAIRGILQEQLR